MNKYDEDGILTMDNLKIKYQLPSGEWKIINTSAKHFIESIIEKFEGSVFPEVVTCMALETKSQCGKDIEILIPANDEVAILTEIK
jgi:hypothetical protein